MKFHVKEKSRIVIALLMTLGHLTLFTEPSSAFELTCFGPSEGEGADQFETDVDFGYVARESIKCFLVSNVMGVHTAGGQQYMLTTKGVGLYLTATNIAPSITCKGLDSPVGTYMFIRETTGIFLAGTGGICSRVSGEGCSLLNQHLCEISGFGIGLGMGFDAGMLKISPIDP